MTVICNYISMYDKNEQFVLEYTGIICIYRILNNRDTMKT